jgi:hypothetical protein
VLNAPHHKNSIKWAGKSITVTLPEEVGVLMGHHVGWGHDLLTRCADDWTPSMFINTGTGQAIKPQEVNRLWSRTVLEGSGKHFGPHQARSVFVSSMRDTGFKEGV